MKTIYAFSKKLLLIITKDNAAIWMTTAELHLGPPVQSPEDNLSCTVQ